MVEVNGWVASPRRMPLTTSPDRADRNLIGQALRNIRERRGFSQGVVGKHLGMTTQGWQKYEAGERKFTDDRIADVLQVLGTDNDELEAEKSEILGLPAPSPGAAEMKAREFIIDVYGRARAGPHGPEIYDVGEPLRRIDLRQMLGANTDAMQVAGDSMVPWAEPGEIVLFDKDSYPRRGSGCVIETLSGEAYVKLYERSDGSTLFVRELYPEERTITFELKKLKGVYAVKLRGD